MRFRMQHASVQYAGKPQVSNLHLECGCNCLFVGAINCLAVDLCIMSGNSRVLGTITDQSSMIREHVAISRKFNLWEVTELWICHF
ncbi:hypothetical protein JTE90_011822 [Oedothorax gibbosus]|uniref:Uncharacterized protein n=1 Tax=Oedothorax gibbosus TaxID=931172 RepID=A0AAV6VR66_9ARAC|nr:hypothetical protein JTE90_011822 [Oedothorax gibbosus]